MNKLILLICALSGAAHAQTNLTATEPAPGVFAGSTIITTSGEQAQTTGKLVILLEQESDFASVLKTFSLRGSNSMPGLPVYVVTAPTGVDINDLRRRMLDDKRIKEVTIDTTAKHYTPQ